LFWQFLTVRYNRAGNWTALFLTGEVFLPPPALSPGTYRFHGEGYDGQFYRYVAHDPLFQRGTQRYIDDPTNRYRRILVPALAFVLAVGQQPYIDGAYMALIAISVFLGSYWVGCWGSLHGLHPASALAFLLVPATLISMDRMVVDVALAALTVAFAYYWETRSWAPVYLVLLLACLVRETGVILIAGSAIFELSRKQFSRSLLWASAASPMLGWYGFVQRMLPASSNYSVPRVFVGSLHTSIFAVILHPPRYPLPPAQEAFARTMDAIALVALLGAFLIAICLLRIRPITPIGISALLFVILAAALINQTGYWSDCNEYARIYSPLLILTAWPVLVSPRYRISIWSAALLIAIVMDLRLGIQLSSQIGGVVRGLLAALMY
jgi:hypothetical protein